MTDEIIPQILEMAQDISPDYMEKPDVVKYASDENRFLLIHKEEVGDVEFINTEEELYESEVVTGFATGGIHTPESFESGLEVTLDEVIRHSELELEHFPISQMKVIAVKDEYRSEGRGGHLTYNVLYELARVSPIVSMIWEKDSDEKANKSLAENYGEYQYTFEDYTPEGWRCPVCGFDNKCTCGSSFYIWWPPEDFGASE